MDFETTTAPLPEIRTAARWGPRTWLAIAWACLILVACWLPPAALPQESGTTAGKLQVDKLIHFALFAVFAWLGMGAEIARGRAGRVFGVGVLLAVVSELGQAVPIVGREPGLPDLLADALGAFAGVVVAPLWGRWRNPPG